MKIKYLIFTVLFLAVAATGFAQISGSKHDFSNASWNTTGNNEICKFCHVPHNGSSVNNAPLWSHPQSAATAYDVYYSPTLNAAPVPQPSGSSKLCLSCHDNTVAVGGNVFIGTIMGGYANLGTDLSNDHPISFTYDVALATADQGLHDPATTPSGVGTSPGTINNDMLFAGKMECASCHDVHNSYNLDNLLIKDNAHSELCLTCHAK